MIVASRMNCAALTPSRSRLALEQRPEVLAEADGGGSHRHCGERTVRGMRIAPSVRVAVPRLSYEQVSQPISLWLLVNHMNSTLRIDHSIDDDIHTVSLSGELDEASCAELAACLGACRAPGARVLLDLRALNFMDGAGIALLERTYVRVERSRAGRSPSCTTGERYLARRRARPSRRPPPAGPGTPPAPAAASRAPARA